MIKRLCIIIIRGYQKYVSPLFGQKCRFFPTCSDYCIEAINFYGPLKGIIKSIFRICRCHPLHPGGYDPIKKQQ